VSALSTTKGTMPRGSKRAAAKAVWGSTEGTASAVRGACQGVQPEAKRGMA
jgi:hypothetical protein